MASALADWHIQIVEELEDRFGEQLDDILSTVRMSLSHPTATSTVPPVIKDFIQTQAIYTEEDMNWDNDAQWEHDANDTVFDDTGEGVGIEGDLDIEDN
jgi:hypothetical protein